MNLTKSDDAQIPNLVKRNSNGEKINFEAQAISVYNETEFKKENSLK